MRWNLIESGFRTGAFNMELDLSLAQNCPPSKSYFRIYRWDPYCISLGANQKFEDVNTSLASENNIDIVKRPTGGRAILHAEELTYSVVVPLSIGLKPKEIYKKISDILIKAIISYDKRLSGMFELEDKQPDFRNLLKENSGILCFASTAKSEVKHRGKKIIGSAQRKIKNVILQHGSILVGNFHRRLPEFINCSDAEKQQLSNEMNEKTIELETILSEIIDYDRLRDTIINTFFSELNSQNYQTIDDEVLNSMLAKQIIT